MTIPEPDLTVTETYNRRIIELRLLHHWTMNTSFTMPGVQIPEVQRIWHTGMVSLALSYPFLLHAIFSLAALHIIRYPDPESPLSIDIYRHYLIAAVNGHRFTLGSLEALSQVDAVHLTSLIISIHLIAELNSGSSGPYKPPTQWLNMATRAGAATNMVCIRKANIQSTFTWATFPPSPHSISRAEVLNRDNISNVGLYNVMERWQGDGDEFPFQETTKAAYEDALAFIGWIELDIRRGLSIHETARRLLAFGHYIIPLFAELVEKGRPRALVILASFFSCFATLGSIWWCEGVANQEVMGIWNILPDNCWKTKMAWAIEKLNLEKEQNYIFENLVSRPSAQGLA
ncbi:hypothetical protein M501DRAFT_1003816 [Patellaria atrata CBS 101060]|uniref:Uncharacterized protein n=1 Tax=Patellaria atrata CBS 101060 TaxID=1346257 RepID=A0A9P4SAS5_9PEZI|nr:hypothetical protein M501DRAFT_1003816 [Patellaria atrata CBS 101060]